MSNRYLEVRKATIQKIAPGANVIFNAISWCSKGISYSWDTGEITFTQSGQYSVRWWITAEMADKGEMLFMLKPSKGGVLIESSPPQKGKLSGYGIIDVAEPGALASLVNQSAGAILLSPSALASATILAAENLDKGAERKAGSKRPLCPAGSFGSTGPEGSTGFPGPTGSVDSAGSKGSIGPIAS